MKKSGILALVLINCSILFSQTGLSAPDEASIRSEMALLKMRGLIAMRFGNALDGKAVPGATVDIPGIGNFTTNNKGIITFPKRADGSFSMTVSKQGFITTPIDFEIQLGFVIFNWYSISPEIPNKDFRMVLDWGEQPSDLDLHFEKTGGYHISYRNTRTASDGNAMLDRDDTSSYGPETITVEKAEARSVYNLFVIDYTNGGNASSSALSRSGAVIRVYSQNRLLQSFSVPANMPGTRWNVFRIENGELVPLNTVTR
ncbi:MAG: hypothetical protein LBP76_08425 [Treponema sp.]|jgi:hypothetical protein|nr:hypothetical protein [Treponema sp.]